PHPHRLPGPSERPNLAEVSRGHRRHRLRYRPRQPLLLLASRETAEAALLAQTHGRPGDAQPSVTVGPHQPRPQPGLAPVQARGTGGGRTLPPGHAVGRHGLRRRAQSRLRPPAFEDSFDGFPVETPQQWPALAADEVPPPDEEAVPTAAASESLAVGVWAA